MIYISDWTIHTMGLRAVIEQQLAARNCTPDDIVWRGPSGDAVIASSPAALSEEYAEYTDAGQVSEYLD